MMNFTPLESMEVPSAPRRILVSVSGVLFTQTTIFKAPLRDGQVQREGQPAI
jgi:hypothetical protein